MDARDAVPGMRVLWRVRRGKRGWTTRSATVLFRARERDRVCVQLDAKPGQDPVVIFAHVANLSWSLV